MYISWFLIHHCVVYVYVQMNSLLAQLGSVPFSPDDLDALSRGPPDCAVSGATGCDRNRAREAMSSLSLSLALCDEPAPEASASASASEDATRAQTPTQAEGTRTQREEKQDEDEDEDADEREEDWHTRSVRLCSQSESMNARKVIERLRLSEQDVISVFVFGSRLWGYC